MKEFENIYSGKKSKLFWDKINAIKEDTEHQVAYTLGCVLQNVEQDILRKLNVIIKQELKEEK